MKNKMRNASDRWGHEGSERNKLKGHRLETFFGFFFSFQNKK